MDANARAMDHHTREAEINAARRGYAARTNRSLSDLVGRLRANPRSFSTIDREAILYVVASRLWLAPDPAVPSVENLAP